MSNRHNSAPGYQRKDPYKLLANLPPPEAEPSPEFLEQLAEFRQVFDDVVENLSPFVKDKIRQFWSRHEEVNFLLRKVEQAPVVAVATNWTEVQKTIPGRNLSYADCIGGTLFIFDSSIAFDAPLIVARTLIAHEIAHAYQEAKDPNFNSRSFRDREREVGRFIGKWGYDEIDIETWTGAVKSGEPDPVNTFYAFRLAQRGAMPPADADLDAIRAILRGKNAPKALERLEQA